MDRPIDCQAQALLARLSEQCSSGRSFGSMSISIYDTAWVSMVRKPDGTWLSPESFEFILVQQLSSGAWESYASTVDGILNTAASLLALQRRIELCTGHPDQAEWLRRSKKAEIALGLMMAEWDSSTSDQVGFEMLITQHITLLRQYGVGLSFAQIEGLQALRDAKLARLPPSSVYKSRSTLCHSLEALIGHIDFDKVKGMKDPNGSMMGSPSSTAAYLMYSSTWDTESEAYLKDVLRYGAGTSDGSVPCAWPTSLFEVTWVITTLFDAGIAIGETESRAIRSFLETTFQRQQGVIGFAPQAFPDADDTAKGISAAHVLGATVSVIELLQTFEGEDHFRTYPNERNPSFSANCNVLVALLKLDDPMPYVPQIAKATRFLTTKAFRAEASDKWHIKEQYWIMLYAQALSYICTNEHLSTRLLELEPDLEEDIPMVATHLLIRTLHTQQRDGSWDGICESTAYATLSLSFLSRLPWIHQIEVGSIVSALALAKSFLLSERHSWATGQYLWIEKVTYACNLLSEAYCLAAASCPLPDLGAPMQHPKSGNFCITPQLRQGMAKASILLSGTPLFSDADRFTLCVAQLSACYAYRALQKRSPDIFPRTAKGPDKYMFIIPLSFTATSAVQGNLLSPYVMFEMMTLSIINFLADEYMEGMIEQHFTGCLADVRTIIQEIFHGIHDSRIEGDKSMKSAINNHPEEALANSRAGIHDADVTLTSVKKTLISFIAHILEHEAVLTSTSSLQKRLSWELESFLLAHVTHAEDNTRMAQQQMLQRSNGRCNGSARIAIKDNRINEIRRSPGKWSHPPRTFYNWVRSTSADHTSCPFSFIFFNCLVQMGSSRLRQSHGDILDSGRVAYLSEDLCRHLASLCRMYNDYGSLNRDLDEDNLNSLGFPEFQKGLETSSVYDEAKLELLWIAEYERGIMMTALEALELELQPKGFMELIDAWRLFINVTDLYGQIYILKDIGTRTKPVK